ncbi:MAG: hypothetical protein OXG56_11655 [Gammaproteobacteria bacterium]|nr:hypothetical protein [Gammaproteobacteria bacterium]
MSNEISKTETWRKSRAFTWMAVVTSLLTVAAFGFFLFKVDKLEKEYGEIRDDRERILREIDNRYEQHSKLLAKIQTLETKKSVLEDDLAKGRSLQRNLETLNEGINPSLTYGDISV